MRIKVLVPAAGLAIVSIIVAFFVASCSSTKYDIDYIKRQLGMTPGTFLNYGADGQVVFEAHCASMAFEPDTKYDVLNADGKVIQPSSVIKVTCGKSQFSTVGFTSVYMSDGALDNLFADSQKFANIKIQNNDRAIPLINFAWRSVTDAFKGKSRAAQVCDQNNNPILAFAADQVVSYSTDVAKSTMFQLIDNKGGEDGYVWVARGSYTVVDTALMNTLS